MPVSIVLTVAEKEAALREGHRRQSMAEGRGTWGRNGGPRLGNKALEAHLIGAMGEMAVATYLGLKHKLYQETEARRGSVDLPPNLDVKTRSRHDRDLIVQLSDTPSKRYILVTIENEASILIHGWINGQEAMQDQYILDPARGRKAYFVPQSALSPIDNLKQCLNARSLLNTLSA